MVGISVAVVLFGASALVPIAAAGADPIAAAKDQVSAVEAEISAGAARVHQLTFAYEQASLDATTLGQQVRADQMQIAQLRVRASGSENVLRKEALESYTGGTGSDLGTPSATTDPAVRAEYLQVAAGNIHDAIDQYRTEQRRLSTAEANLALQEQASRAAAASAIDARQRALAQAGAEQGQLDRLQGQLDQYVEAAAIAAQQHAAAAAAPAVTAPATTQGLPVNNGLLAVVRTIVAAPAPAPAAPPPPPPPSRAAPSARPAAPASPPSTPGYTDAGGVWLQLRECESSDNYAENTGNGFYGAYQFSEQTWTDLGFPGRPDLEPHQLQDEAAVRLEAQSGWGQWPACAAALGLH